MDITSLLQNVENFRHANQKLRRCIATRAIKCTYNTRIKSPITNSCSKCAPRARTQALSDDATG